MEENFTEFNYGIQDQNAMITKIFAKDAHGCVVVCDSTNRQTREETIKQKKSVDEEVIFLMVLDYLVFQQKIKLIN